MGFDRKRLAVAAAQLVALALIQSGDARVSGFPLDDAWIHALVARTLVEEGTLGITPGLHGSGATSTLWALLLAAGEVLGVSPPRFAFALNAGLLLAMGQLLFGMLLADGVPRTAAIVFAVVAGCAPNFVWFAASGMEATLVACASCAAIAGWFAADRRRQLGGGLALAALALARPEGVALAPLLGLLRRPRGGHEWARLVAPAALAVLASAAVQFVHTGQVLPATLAGRKWMWLAPLEGLHPIAKIAVLLADWMNRLSEFTFGRLDHVSFWVVAGFVAVGAAPVLSGSRQRALALWTVAHLGVYAVLLPTFGHAGRYQPLVPVVSALLCAVGARRVFSLLSEIAIAPARAEVIALAGVATLAVLGPGRALLVWRRAHADSVEHVTHTEIAMGRKLAALPRGARIASFDIGGIGYFSRRPIVEIGGLSSSAIAPLLWQGKVADYLREERVDYVVVPLGLGGARAQEPWNFAYRLGLSVAPELELEPVASLASPLVEWRRGVRATMHCAPRQDLYAVRFSARRGEP